MTKSISLLFLYFFISAEAFSQDTIVVNGSKFLFLEYTRASEDHVESDTMLSVYRIEFGEKVLLLSHALFAQHGDCNSVFTDFGNYFISSDSIIFTTEYEVDRSKNFGSAIYRKQIYIVESDGKMILIYDKREFEDGRFEDSKII